MNIKKMKILNMTRTNELTKLGRVVGNLEEFTASIDQSVFGEHHKVPEISAARNTRINVKVTGKLNIRG